MNSMAQADVDWQGELAREGDNADLIWNTGNLGGWLRLVRMDRGFSQMGLAAMSGVEPSEIHRIEIGQQESRIETLVKLCGVLGVTPGWILDRVVQSNVAFFNVGIQADVGLERLRRKLLGEAGTFDPGIGAALASAAVLAAILIRASSPRERLAVAEFPGELGETWRDAFAAFADRLEALGADSSDRAGMLHCLVAHPLAELERQKLIVEAVFWQAIAQKKSLAWAPWVVRFPREIKWSSRGKVKKESAIRRVQANPNIIAQWERRESQQKGKEAKK